MFQRFDATILGRKLKNERDKNNTVIEKIGKILFSIGNTD
jgi:hypothetical protein